jgi:hypothetical protein
VFCEQFGDVGFVANVNESGERDCRRYHNDVKIGRSSVEFSVCLAEIDYASEICRAISALTQEILEGVADGKRLSRITEHLCESIQHLNMTKSLTLLWVESSTTLNPNAECTQWWFGCKKR